MKNNLRKKTFSVSMGGTAGLFLGASLLSVIEIVYYCCIRQRGNQLESGPKPESDVKPKKATGFFQRLDKLTDPKKPGYQPKPYLSHVHFYE